LYVKSFINPLLKGTSVSKGKLRTVFTVLLSLKETMISSSIDFSFIMEENISEIFSLFHEFKLKVNLIQNTYISPPCVEDKFDNFNELNAILSKKIQS
jgi:aspartate kinase